MNSPCDHMVSLRLRMILIADCSGWELVHEDTGICKDKNYKSQQEEGERESSSSTTSASLQQSSSYLYRNCVWQEKQNLSRFMTLSAYAQVDSIPEDLQDLLYQRTIEHFRDNF